ncbi:hypothetical protein [Paraconexibacter sp.]|uniref:hypothetical protein n=1 Tax=Paraconexibacter sp. TaxID=2949640 RepID=UPI0035699C17
MTFNVKTTVALLASSLVVAPATAQAQGSLLSGYSGPGGGEQVILGAQLLGGGSGGGGGGSGAGGDATPSLRAAVPSGAVTAPGTAAPDTAGAVQGAPAAPKRGSEGSTATKESSGRQVLNPVPPAFTQTSSPGAPTRLAYPAADGAGALPFDAKDLGLLLAAAITLVLVAVATRRLGRWQAGGPDAA